MNTKQLTKTMAALLIALSVAPAALAADLHTTSSAKPSAAASTKPAAAKPSAAASTKPAAAKPSAAASTKPAVTKPSAAPSNKPAAAKPAAKPAAASKGAPMVNSNVQVKWDGHWYAGTVKQVKNGLVLVKWTRNNTTGWVNAAHVRVK
ncbi:MAG: hypothetical protein H7338_21605 [Candidatus Sericytochromatia bacterium]|nr:hypothetical protein [Candidatus Sericytochromatia bacterium]